jgi:hypothetical protein
VLRALRPELAETAARASLSSIQGGTRLRSRGGWSGRHCCTYHSRISKWTDANALQKSRGLVCIPRLLAARGIVNHYRELGIGVAVFSITTPEQALKVEQRIDPEIMYVDRAEVFGALRDT